jgi:hypothetical protein
VTADHVYARKVFSLTQNAVPAAAADDAAVFSPSSKIERSAVSRSTVAEIRRSSSGAKAKNPPWQKSYGKEEK